MLRSLLLNVCFTFPPDIDIFSLMLLDVFNESQSKKKANSKRESSEHPGFLWFCGGPFSITSFCCKSKQFDRQSRSTISLSCCLPTANKKKGKLLDAGALLICSKLRRWRVLIVPRRMSIYLLWVCALTAVWVDTFDPDWQSDRQLMGKENNCDSHRQKPSRFNSNSATLVN